MKVLVTGGRGMLAQAVQRIAHERGHEAIGLAHAELDVTDAPQVSARLRAAAPHAVIHCAAYTRVDQAEHERDAAFAVNAESAAHVARACADLGAAVVYPSTDYVFDGTADRPYLPDDAPRPLNVYGASKLAGEENVRSAPHHYVVRTSWLYGAGGTHFVGTMLQRARAREPLRVVQDQRGSPTWTDDLAGALLGLLEQQAPAGTYHACNRGEATWYDLAQAVLELERLDAELQPIASAELKRPARRPAYSVLDSSSTERVVGALPHWRAALERALQEGVS